MTHRQDRIWLLGGVVAMILLMAGGWFLLISPKNAETDGAQSRIEDANAQLIVLKRQAAMLKSETAKLPAYTAQKATLLKALPATSGVPDFLRQLQDSGTAVDVEIGGITVGGPAPTKAMPSVYELPISLTASGGVTNISDFLNRLQAIQPRAVLLGSIGLTGAPPDDVTVSISLKAFVSPPAGKGTPATTTN
ncbi:type 4a pilus biogenesis protein PilO [Micromonosporaceae bacterium Da 78-11]